MCTALKAGAQALCTLMDGLCSTRAVRAGARATGALSIGSQLFCKFHAISFRIFKFEKLCAGHTAQTSSDAVVSLSAIPVTQAVDNAATSGRHSDELQLRRNELRDLLAQVPLDHLRVAEAELQLGITLHKLGRYRKARVHTQKALCIRKQKLHKDDLKVAEAELQLGSTLHKLSRLEDARKHKETALRIRRGNLPDKNLMVAQAELELSITLHDLRLHSAALEHAETALHIGTEMQDDLTVAKAELDVGAALRQLGNPEAALKNFKRAMKKLPTESFDMAHSRLEMGAALNDMGQHGDAWPHVKYAIVWQREHKDEAKCLEFAKVLRQQREQRIQQALLSDRDARRNSLQNLSVVAVLLAAAAFVAFASSPQQPAVAKADTQEIALRGASVGTSSDPAAIDGTVAPTDSAASLQPTNEDKWVRNFFRSDQVAFGFAIAAVLYVLVGSLPRRDAGSQSVQAGRFWISLLLLSVCVGTAVVSAILSFQFAAVSVYPEDWLWRDVGGIEIVTGALVVAAMLYWVVELQRICPGGKSLKQGLESMATLGLRDDMNEPVPGTDESAYEMYKLLKELRDQNAGVLTGQKDRNAEVIAMLKEQKEVHAQNVEVLNVLKEQNAEMIVVLKEQKEVHAHNVDVLNVLKEQNAEVIEQLQDVPAQTAARRA